jgi:hypothetical protein
MKTGATGGNRRADQAETAVTGVLMAAFTGVSPFVAYAAGRWAGAAFSRTAQAQRALLRQVPATLRQDTPGHGTKAVPDTPAQWQGPDGLLRAGLISAPAGVRAGSRVKVWINAAGDVVTPPMQQDAIARRVELAQGLAAAGFAAGLGVTGWLTHRGLNQHRQAA